MYLFLVQYLWPQNGSRFWGLYMAVEGSLLYEGDNKEARLN